MKTESIKGNDIVRDWYVVDAKDKTLGRLASSVAHILRGKNKVNYSPNLDMSDFIIVINAEKVVLTGNKQNTKEYWRHTGYPGGQKTVSYKKMLDEKPDQVIRKAVKGMLPHNKLGRKLLNHLKVYSGTNHPHKAQSPKELSIN
jgi:large subunit ribosomal protein L13|tara:strand:- start:42308 stop:42739 length:432 start_codon:yes stop_codon:yes gene_type:complete